MPSRLPSRQHENFDSCKINMQIICEYKFLPIPITVKRFASCLMHQNCKIKKIWKITISSYLILCSVPQDSCMGSCFIATTFLLLRASINSTVVGLIGHFIVSIGIILLFYLGIIYLFIGNSLWTLTCPIEYGVNSCYQPAGCQDTDHLIPLCYLNNAMTCTILFHDNCVPPLQTKKKLTLL